VVREIHQVEFDPYSFSEPIISGAVHESDPLIELTAYSIVVDNGLADLRALDDNVRHISSNVQGWRRLPAPILGPKKGNFRDDHWSL